MHRASQTRKTAHTPDTLSRVPNKPKTPNRAIRVDTDLWHAAMKKAEAEGRTLTGVIVAYLKRYVSTPPRKKADADD
jgi:hypothetical protein